MKINRLNMKRCFVLFCFLINYLLIFSSGAFAQSDVYLSIKAGSSVYMGVGIEGFEAQPPVPGDSTLAVVKRTLIDDLNFSGLFEVKTLTDSLSASSVDLFSKWKNAGAKIYIIGEPKSSNGPINVNVIDLKTGATVLKETYAIQNNRPWYTAHVIVDDLIQKFTGIRGSMASQIAFINPYKGRNTEIHIIDADGRNRHQITFSKTLNISPNWSRDGKFIAYSSLTNNQWALMKININTGQTQTISRWPGLNTSPSWSPVDNDVLLFSSNRDGNNEIYSARSDGKNVKRLTNHIRIDSGPDFSPDGKQIAFSSDRTGQPAIYVMDSDGSNVRRLTSNMNAYEDSPDWSPRGDRIAYVMLFDRDFDIASVSPTGEDVVLLTSAQGSNENPKWSPDGLRIVFSSSRGGGKDIFIMNWDGTKVRQLTFDSSSFSPSWSPTTLGNDIRVSSKR
jgi:TolB protein